MRNGQYNLEKAPEKYPGKTYRLNLVPEHHLVWWREKDEVIGENEVIHHKNGDKKDNRLENLEKLSRSEHSKRHMDEVGRKYAVIECPECGNEFEKPLNQTFMQKPGTKANFCDRSCQLRFYGSNDIDNEEMEKKYLKKVYLKKGD